MKKLIVDQEKCIGCGSCVSICPKVFVLEGGKSKVIDQAGDSEVNIKLAIDACPTQAISWVEE
jgi:ferredoxin